MKIYEDRLLNAKSSSPFVRVKGRDISIHVFFRGDQLENARGRPTFMKHIYR